MIHIQKATIHDAKILSEVGFHSFKSAHGHSAPKKDIEEYMTKNFTENVFFKELSNEKNQFYLIKYNEIIVGYTLVIFDKKEAQILVEKPAYLSRIYLLEAYYGLGLGKQLFDFIKSLCIENQQSGIWLNVWVENLRAISFYKKMGFEIVGKSDYQISATHSNPNHVMFLHF
ncbi:MAG: GNAT family N-acetyltransferase [Flavobacteriia bacterium]|nr:GNAT family N-acetyltransferase [Flavobacteriia bacterium]OIP48349.1 MAG: GNAT family N-acetyltransferase [Flavobacteriaceae bacterium CG2_30_31_66]PIV96296.1 MAG: GNAT family N-acetyltransferase [Flavobacteriaceae bacterium CG17_big_fil_post_rev_8_21_14_2_50_31_13]PIX15087.1 MAG: GNAT family N-acetyltransferase [Flavobacteriaceae bacterium CG_4_8_14_3_um_filter_31_8]PIY13556.1 MAG: GNAT family N-acetyltransferase [Flavobacteriaceae bacterium CG_4_10_14_3_um_filter_31_253]PIZ09433.1 MAG: GN